MSRSLLYGQSDDATWVPNHPLDDMALCIRVEPTAESIATAFAKNDLVLKCMAARDWKNAGDADAPVRAMGPGDDYYTAPYAVVPMKRRKSKCNPEPKPVYWLVFTSYKVRDAHDAALATMKDYGQGIVLVGSTVGIEHGELAGTKAPRTTWTRFREMVWAGGDDVCTKLEDHSFQAACATLGIAPATMPTDWRALRTTVLDVMCADLKSTDPHFVEAPLAKLPEWGSVPFAAKSSAERA